MKMQDCHGLKINHTSILDDIPFFLLFAACLTSYSKSGKLEAYSYSLSSAHLQSPEALRLSFLNASPTGSDSMKTPYSLGKF